MTEEMGAEQSLEGWVGFGRAETIPNKRLAGHEKHRGCKRAGRDRESGTGQHGRCQIPPRQGGSRMVLRAGEER